MHSKLYFWYFTNVEFWMQKYFDKWTLLLLLKETSEHFFSYILSWWESTLEDQDYN